MKKTVDVNNTKIIICCHKPCRLPNNDVFLPVHVGAAISKFDLGIQRDDQVNGETCDNISSKNPNYCELTAMYWAWKNIKKMFPDLKYIGLNHYRRYFEFEHAHSIKDIFVKNENDVEQYKFDTAKMISILQNNDVIVAKKKQYQYPLYIDYCLCHMSDDLRVLRSVIGDKCPVYMDAFDSVMMRNGALAPYNMNILGWETFDMYCSWLFSILTEVEQRINISNYNNVQARIFGYMAERLWNVFFVHQKLKVKELPILWFVDGVSQHSWAYCLLRNLWAKASNLILGLGHNKF